MAHWNHRWKLQQGNKNSTILFNLCHYLKMSKASFLNLRLKDNFHHDFCMSNHKHIYGQLSLHRHRQWACGSALCSENYLKMDMYMVYMTVNCKIFNVLLSFSSSQCVYCYASPPWSRERLLVINVWLHNEKMIPLSGFSCFAC